MKLKELRCAIKRAEYLMNTLGETEYEKNAYSELLMMISTELNFRVETKFNNYGVGHCIISTYDTTPFKSIVRFIEIFGNNNEEN